VRFGVISGNLGLNGLKIKLGMVWIEHGRSVTIDVIYLVPFYSTRLIDIQSTWRSQPSGCSIQKMIYCKNRMDWNWILTHVWAQCRLQVQGQTVQSPRDRAVAIHGWRITFQGVWRSKYSGTLGCATSYYRFLSEMRGSLSGH
jgi:hypothetical protein